MRLADFIVDNRESILAEWEAFARTCAPASGTMNMLALRDHASEMLMVIAADLRTPECHADEGRVKSHGLILAVPGSPATAATAHGADRAESGFTVEQMLSEYRALRASVVRLWRDGQAGGAAGEPADVEDLVRFNEAVDQALAESITRYSRDLDHSREIFLAILGHDLRSPLGAIAMSSQFMLETGELAEPHLTLTRRIKSSSARMLNLIGDLLDFTRSRLGGGIPLSRKRENMERIVRDVIDELAAAYPGRTLEMVSPGRVEGEWDCDRLTQAFGNLVGNALQHGSLATPVVVEIAGDATVARVSIHNRGAAIPPSALRAIFDPMKRRGDGRTTSAPGARTDSLGLGLFIAERVVHAHGGSISIESSDLRGTTFTVSLPVQAPREVGAGPA